MAIRLAFLVIVLTVGAASVSLAQDCMQHIQSTEESMLALRRQVTGVDEDSRRRIEGFIADAEKIIVKAREDCPRAQTPLDRSFVVGKVMVAQGNLAAAQLVLKYAQK